MPYGKLAEGDRVWTAVAGPSASADINEFQDQLKAMCGPRAMGLPLCSFMAPDGSGFVFDESEDPMRWEEETHTSGGYLLVPISLPDDCEIKQADVWLKGSGTQTGGSVRLMRQPNAGGSAKASVADIDTSDPWAVAVITKLSSGTISVVVDGDYNYFIEIVNATGGPIADNYVYGASVTYQLGT